MCSWRFGYLLGHVAQLIPAEGPDGGTSTQSKYRIALHSIVWLDVFFLGILQLVCDALIYIWSLILYFVNHFVAFLSISLSPTF